MVKLYFFVVLAVGGYFYTHPERFDVLRGEVSAQLMQTVDTVQAKVTNGIVDAVGGTDGEAGN